MLIGSAGEPTLHPEVVEICDYFIREQESLVAISTNGSTNTPDWWYNLGKVLGQRGFVLFAIDGLEDTSKLYRVNCDFNKTLENAKAFIKAGGVAHWYFTLFNYNKDQVEIARSLADKLGFTRFVVRYSWEFEHSQIKTIPNPKLVDFDFSKFTYVKCYLRPFITVDQIMFPCITFYNKYAYGQGNETEQLHSIFNPSFGDLSKIGMAELIRNRFYSTLPTTIKTLPMCKKSCNILTSIVDKQPGMGEGWC